MLAIREKILPYVPEVRFVPYGRAVLVLEDPDLLEQTCVHTVPDPARPGEAAVDENGDPLKLHLVEAYDGQTRVPALRRAMVVKLSDRLKTRGLEWTYTRQDGFDTVVQNGRPVKMGRSVRQFRRDLCSVKPGDHVWYVSKNVGHQTIEEDGLTFKLIGMHQIDFEECNDDDPNGVDPTRFDLV